MIGQIHIEQFFASIRENLLFIIAECFAGAKVQANPFRKLFKIVKPTFNRNFACIYWATVQNQGVRFVGGRYACVVTIIVGYTIPESTVGINSTVAVRKREVNVPRLVSSISKVAKVAINVTL